jgi:chromatin segregation and condensation protein Rec8/ScpA/Scc1 (kleisin family)
LEKATEEVHGNTESTKAEMISTFMDMLMLARNGAVKITQHAPSEEKMWNIDGLNDSSENKNLSNIEMEF